MIGAGLPAIRAAPPARRRRKRPAVAAAAPPVSQANTRPSTKRNGTWWRETAGAGTVFGVGNVMPGTPTSGRGVNQRLRTGLPTTVVLGLGARRAVGRAGDGVGIGAGGLGADTRAPGAAIGARGGVVE